MDDGWPVRLEIRTADLTGWMNGRKQNTRNSSGLRTGPRWTETTHTFVDKWKAGEEQVQDGGWTETTHTFVDRWKAGEEHVRDGGFSGRERLVC